MDIERSPERNDVDISALFKWNKKVDVKDMLTGMETHVYMRLLGDADLGKARAYAYRKAGEYRKALRTADSDERVSLLAELNEFQDKEVIIKAVILLKMGDYYNAAIKNVDFREPQEPDSDEQEDWEKYQKAVDEYPKLFKEKITQIVEVMRERDEKDYAERSIESVYKIYESEVINRLAQEKMTDSFYDMCLYLATFSDEKFKHRAFKSFDDYENVHPTLKSILKENYQSLEIGTDFLKKLPGVTVSP